jgi:hypothetical protein
MQQGPATTHDELRMSFTEIQALYLVKKAEVERLQQEAKRHVYHALSLCISIERQLITPIVTAQ